MLLLFDIDGTLLGGTRQAVGEAMLAALREVHGIDVGVIRTRFTTAIPDLELYETLRGG